MRRRLGKFIMFLASSTFLIVSFVHVISLIFPLAGAFAEYGNFNFKTDEIEKSVPQSPPQTPPSTPQVPAVPSIPAASDLPGVKRIPGVNIGTTAAPNIPTVMRFNCESGRYSSEETYLSGEIIPAGLQCSGGSGEWTQTCGKMPDGTKRTCVPDYIAYGESPQSDGDCVCIPPLPTEQTSPEKTG